MLPLCLGTVSTDPSLGHWGLPDTGAGPGASSSKQPGKARARTSQKQIQTPAKCELRKRVATFSHRNVSHTLSEIHIRAPVLPGPHWGRGAVTILCQAPGIRAGGLGHLSGPHGSHHLAGLPGCQPQPTQVSWNVGCHLPSLREPRLDCWPCCPHTVGAVAGAVGGGAFRSSSTQGGGDTQQEAHLPLLVAASQGSGLQAPEGPGGRAMTLPYVPGQGDLGRQCLPFTPG